MTTFYVSFYALAHATLGAVDAMRELENVLTDFLGSTGSKAVGA